MTSIRVAIEEQLALSRLTGGPVVAALLGSLSHVVWTVAPLVIAARRLARADV